MRLKRLDLTRYGKFTDHTLDFGEAAKDAPDFHIIYGPNEAGKSTALAAYLDLLFGIEMRSPYNFLHPYPTMQIGGALELAGGAVELIRIKRPQRSLLDASQQPISEGILLSELGGINRDSYRSMFSLDDDTLEAGGNGILESKGELGQLLFAASAGLTHLSKRLVDLRQETGQFYRRQAHSGELQTLKSDLAKRKEAREQIDTIATRYAQLVEIQDRAAAQYQTSLTERGTIQLRMSEIERHLGALPRLAALRDIRQRLLPLIDLPEAPLGWIDEFPPLQQHEIELATQAKGAADEISRISAELETITVDEAALQLAGRLDRMTDLRARHQTAEIDIPARIIDRTEVDLAIAGILNRLGRPNDPDPDRLVLGAVTVGALRALIETRSGIEAGLAAAQQELSQSLLHLEETRAVLQRDGGNAASVPDVTMLAAVVAGLRSSDHAARHRLAERAGATHARALAVAIPTLSPWHGEIGQLARMVTPTPAELNGWRTALTVAETQIERLEAEIQRLDLHRLRLAAELKAIASATGVVTDQDAAELRAAREAAWAAHRRTLDAASADKFETALRQDDIVLTARLQHEKERTKLHESAQALAVLDAERGHAQNLLNTATGNHRRIQDAIAVSVRAMTPLLPESTSLVQLEAWLARRATALDISTSLQQMEADLQQSDTDARIARDRLTEALIDIGLSPDADANFNVLMTTAQAAVDGERGRKTLRDAVVNSERDVKAREHALQRAATKDQTWTIAWTEACQTCWLAESLPTPSQSTVREILAAVAELGPALEKRAGLVVRIHQMKADQTAFDTEIRTIATELGFDAAQASALELARAITDRIVAAGTAQSERTAHAQLLDHARTRQRKIVEALAIHATRKTAMTEFFAVGSLAEVGDKLQATKKKADLVQQLESAEQDIVTAMRLPTIMEAQAALDTADHAALEAELPELQARFQDQDQRTRDLHTAHSKAVDQLESVGGDEAVAVIEAQRRTILLDIEDKALRHLRLRIGIVAAEQALRAYRDKHRSSMMTHASDAFRTISRNAYNRLATRPDKDGDVLIAVAADNSSKIASDLSKGTRFQLYLALRVAGYHEFCQSRPPVPFIADDILETFDDFRAEEAFGLFRDMARIGQVIYLTHHPHLCEIARRTFPGVQIHNLGEASA